MPAKVQGGVVGGDHLAGQRSKVGCGPGTFKVHLARYLEKVLSGRPTFPVQRAFTTAMRNRERLTVPVVGLRLLQPEFQPEVG